MVIATPLTSGGQVSVTTAIRSGDRPTDRFSTTMGAFMDVIFAAIDDRRMTTPRHFDDGSRHGIRTITNYAPPICRTKIKQWI
jgi:hypothetical protein